MQYVAHRMDNDSTCIMFRTCPPFVRVSQRASGRKHSPTGFASNFLVQAQIYVSRRGEA